MCGLKIGIRDDNISTGLRFINGANCLKYQKVKQ